jgi:tRNA-dihydrouridine synthase B
MSDISKATTPIIYLAPLQGFTDYTFRNAFTSVFGAPDKAFSPFIDSHRPDQRAYRDVLPEKNTGLNLIPQVLGNNAKEVLVLVNELQKMGYSEINLNMGCPYPMVTKKGMGAGILPHPDKIEQLLNHLFSETSLKISVKMRLGLVDKENWKALVPILNSYPLNEVIIHGRTASQMYKGEVDHEAFEEFSKQLKHPVCYNGNIFTLEDYQTLSKRFPQIYCWMLGRGLIVNPLLMKEIQNGVKSGEDEIRKALENLHDKLLEINTGRLSGSSHLLNKMKPYWEYFAFSLAGREKALKKIKKSVKLESYQAAVNEVFRG